MQGRIDAIELMTANDSNRSIVGSIADETGRMPPSVVYFSLVNDHVQCAEWLTDQGFTFKTGEPDQIVKRILADQGPYSIAI